MALCAFFISAPTVRFLNTIERVRLLPTPERRKIAADVHSAIASFRGSTDLEQFRRCAQALQDERWRLISSGVSDIVDVQFARVVIVEQWLRTQIELLIPGSPITEILAERRCRAIDQFVLENFSAGTGEVITLHPTSQKSSIRPGEASKTAA